MALVVSKPKETAQQQPEAQGVLHGAPHPLATLLASGPKAASLQLKTNRANRSPRVAALNTLGQSLNAGRTPGIAQREVVNKKVKEEDLDKIRDIETFFTNVDTATQNAYKYVVSVPTLGAYAALNGYSDQWSTSWAAYMGGALPSLMAAKFGYAIETLVSHSSSEFVAKAPSGCGIATQVAVGGTRPDLVLTRDGAHLAWADLTAANSGGHIFDKDGWEQKIDNFAEVTYDSLDLATMTLMRGNNTNTGALTTAELQQRKEASRLAHLANQQSWYTFGERFKKSNCTLPMNREHYLLNPTALQAFIQQKLKTDFGLAADIDLAMVPSILAAMGVSASAWGFGIGYTGSVAAGEAWLLDNPPP